MKNLKQKLAVIALGFVSWSLAAQVSTGTIKGEVLTDDNLPLIGGTVKITQGGVLIGGTTTDDKGRYTYKPLNAGTYEVIVSSFESQTKKVTDVWVSSEKTTYLDVSVSANNLGTVDVVAYTKPIIEKTFMSMKEITAEDFLRMAVDRGNIKDAVINMSSEVTKDANGDLHVRGGRGDATAFIIDGVRSPYISGVAALAVENVAVITGGVPAQYGDNTSGVIVINTKDYFSGMQSKRMRQNYILENKERVKREKEAMQKDKERKKEIEEELKKEAEERNKRG